MKNCVVSYPPYSTRSPGKTALNRRSKTLTGTITPTASTWISFRASRCSVRPTSSSPGRAGRVSRGRWSRKTWSRYPIGAFSWCAPKCAADTPIRTWAIVFNDGPAADRTALLHQFCRPAVCSRGRFGEGRLRRIPPPVPNIQMTNNKFIRAFDVRNLFSG